MFITLIRLVIRSTICGKDHVMRIEVFTAVTVKNACRLHIMLQLLVTTNVAHSVLIIFTLMTEAIRPSETSALTRAIRRHIPEDGNLR
jgi:hypothetical protein